MRAVVYVLVLLVVIGMILAMVGSTLAAAAPTGPAPEAASSSRPAPVVVLGTSNLTWADLQKASHTTAGEDLGSRDVGSAATHLLSFTSGGEPMSLSVRTPADRTCPADGWLTLGRGARASAVEPTDSCTGTTAAIPGDTPLIRALGGDISVQAVGPRAQLATGAPGSSPSTSVSLAPSLPEALADGADLTVVDTARDVSTDAERINALDDALRTAQEQAPPGTRIIVASLADDEDPGPQMAVLPAGTTSTRGTSDGLVIGTSTHRPGLAQLTDLTPTLTTALTGRSDPAFDGQSLGLPTGGGTSVPPNTAAPDDSRIARLADDALHARASQRTVIPAGALLMGSAVALLVWAAVALRDPRADRRPARRRRAAGAATFLSALPTALLLVNAVPWWRAGAREGAPSAWSQAAALTGATVIAACVTGLAAGTTTLVRRRRHLRPVISSSASEASAPPLPLRPSPSPVGLTSLLVTATIPLAWLVDAATGAHLAFNNPLGMNAVVAGRFYGVSNTAFALVAGALVVVIAGTWEHLGRGRRTALVATCLLGGAALVVDGAPQLGADVGGALTLVPTLAFLGAGLAGMRLSWRRWLAIGGATLLVVGGFAVVDLLRPGGPTHLGRFARQVADGSALGVLGRKAYALVGPFIAKPMATAGLACALALLAAALWWLRRQVRDWHAGTSPYAWVAPSVRWVTVALRSLGVLTLMSVLVNDSGVTMAGFILAAAAPALMALLLAPAQIETDTALRPTDASHDAGV
ncbi:conserved domain protein [Actinomyces sp. oral taxon 170 str. F0386]|nr:conserved domain protein [Actinomyces sp. oral taxon 170 str. F0386]